MLIMSYQDRQTQYLILDLNNKHSSNSLKRKLNSTFKSITKKAKCKFTIQYEVSGESFLTKPNKTTYMIQNTIKKNY